MKVISYSIYGDNGVYWTYLPSMLRAHHILFPGWKVVIYHDGINIYNMFYGDVLLQLSEQGLIDLVATESSGKQCESMLWRCKAIWDYPNAEAVFFRDIDSCPTGRERMAVEHFIKSDKFVHGINDCNSHTVPIMGGMWGCKPRQFVEATKIQSFAAFIKMALDNVDLTKHGGDQVFLQKCILPIIKQNLLIHKNGIPEIGISDVIPVALQNNSFCNYIGTSGYRKTRVIEFYNALQNETLKRIESAEHFSNCNILMYNFTRKSTSSLNQKRVVMSSSNNPDYYFYIPIVSLVWQHVIGYCPIILLIGSFEGWMTDERRRLVLNMTRMTGAEIYFVNEIDGFNPSTVAQSSRLYAGALSYDEDTYLLTSDVDMLPLCREFFNQQSFNRKMHLFYANAYGHEKYPLSYIGAQVGIWRTVMKINDSLLNSLRTQLTAGLGKNADSWVAWNYDETLFACRIKEWQGYPGDCHMIDRHGGPPSDRIDRSRWIFEGSLKGKSDAHLIRPAHTGENWNKFRAVLEKLLCASNLFWVDKYVELYNCKIRPKEPINKTNWFGSPNEWQFVDPQTGFIFPWLVISFIEMLVTVDISKWTIFEAGCGIGTLWWAFKCKKVVVLETNKEWIDKVKAFAESKGLTNIEYHFTKPESTPQFKKEYLDVLSKQECKFDAVIVDGLYRDDVAILAEKCVKTGGWIIADNYQQEEVWDARICSEYLNSRYKIMIFKQPPILNPESHPWIWNENKDCFSKIRKGHPHWQTAYWIIE